LIEKSKSGGVSGDDDDDSFDAERLSEKSIDQAELLIEKQFDLKEEKHVEQIRLEELKKQAG